MAMVLDRKSLLFSTRAPSPQRMRQFIGHLVEEGARAEIKRLRVEEGVDNYANVAPHVSLRRGSFGSHTYPMKGQRARLGTQDKSIVTKYKRRRLY
eukprot:1427815-Pleurochrysis_carterae.AAC.4